MSRLKLANKELRGVRATLARLFLSVVAFFLSVIGIIFILLGWQNIALAMILIGNALLSAVIGIQAIKNLQIILPMLTKMMR